MNTEVHFVDHYV